MTQLPMLTPDSSGPAIRGRCHVHFGDWREQEPDWPRPFVFVSDVPYGIGYKSSYVVYKSGNARATDLSRSILGDSNTLERDAIMAVPGWGAAAIFGPRRLDRHPPWGDPREVLAWDRGRQVGLGDLDLPWSGTWETVAIYGPGWKGKRGVGCLRCEKPNTINIKHPHQKPVDLLTELCSKAPPGLPIVDPFMGSGTTAVACALLGREFWGAEIDPQYFEVIRGRLAAVGVTI